MSRNPKPDTVLEDQDLFELRGYVRELRILVGRARLIANCRKTVTLCREAGEILRAINDWMVRTDFVASERRRVPSETAEEFYELRSQ